MHMGIARANGTDEPIPSAAADGAIRGAQANEFSHPFGHTHSTSTLAELIAAASWQSRSVLDASDSSRAHVHFDRQVKHILVTRRIFPFL